MSSSDPQEEALGVGWEEGSHGQMELRLPLLVAGSHLWERGGQSLFQHAIRLLLVQFPCPVHLQGRVGARR